MNLQPVLEEKIGRARAWLAAQGEHGIFADWAPATTLVDGEAPPNIGLRETGAAAHLFAWLFLNDGGADIDRRAAAAACDAIVSWHGAGECLGTFDQLGAAARGCYAASKAFGKAEYWDLSIALGSTMRQSLIAREPEDPPRSPGERKPAMIFKLLKRVGDYDDLDLHFFHYEWAEPKRPCDAADQLAQLASSCEALIMGDASICRGRREFDLLVRRLSAAIGKGAEIRVDVLAQYMRLCMVQGLQIPQADMHRLFEFQHESGGFHDRLNKRSASPRLSILGTIYAIQAMVMMARADACVLPGKLTRKELALI